MTLDDLLRILSTQGLTVGGVLLAVLVVYAWAINTEKLVSGPRWRALKADKDALQAALDKANGELGTTRQDYIDMRVEMAEMRARIEERALLTLPPRRRQGGGS